MTLRKTIIPIVLISGLSLTGCGDAQKMSDSNKCASTAEIHEQARCFRDVAVTYKDKSICEKIPDAVDPSYKKNCYERIIIATGTQDCPAIADAQTRDMCYVHVATAKKDLAACGNIVTPSLLDVCHSELSQAMGDERYCDKAGGQADFCFRAIAHLRKQPALCEKAVTPDNKDSCYLDMVLLMQDSSFCSKITSETIRSQTDLCKS